jgi:hypothetical protein
MTEKIKQIKLKRTIANKSIRSFMHTHVLSFSNRTLLSFWKKAHTHTQTHTHTHTHTHINKEQHKNVCDPEIKIKQTGIKKRLKKKHT